jgi:hypothetical protein
MLATAGDRQGRSGTQPMGNSASHFTLTPGSVQAIGHLALRASKGILRTHRSSLCPQSTAASGKYSGSLRV